MSVHKSVGSNFSKKRFTFHQNGFAETVEVACEFQHDDIVWITENDERKIGRVIDLRMRVCNFQYLWIFLVLN